MDKGLFGDRAHVAQNGLKVTIVKGWPDPPASTFQMLRFHECVFYCFSCNLLSIKTVEEKTP